VMEGFANNLTIKECLKDLSPFHSAPHYETSATARDLAEKRVSWRVETTELSEILVHNNQADSGIDFRNLRKIKACKGSTYTQESCIPRVFA